MNVITISNKMDMSYGFHIKHNMHAVERKLYMIIAKTPHPIISLNRYTRHLLIRKRSHTPFNK